MFELKAKEYNGARVIDSRDVAVMVERNHNELLKTIRIFSGYLREGDFAQSDFFIESTYLNAQNHETPNYLITKKGCDMIANKMIGKKGVLFTAAYVTAFNDMRDYLSSIPPIPPSVSPGGIASLISVTRRVMCDQGSTPMEIAIMTQGIYKTYNMPLSDNFVKETPEQLTFFNNDQLTGGK